MRIGAIDLEIINDGYFYLDGGMMFGIVPRTLWERRLPPDDRNRVRLALRTLLIRAGERIIVVDTGVGDKFGVKEREIYRVERNGGQLAGLAEHGIQPADVDLVVNTHLHFDHAGGNTVIQDGQVIPTFPRAEYLAQRDEWDDAIQPNERTRASYLADNLRPVAAAGQLRLIEGETEIAPGVSWVRTPGHTRGHTSILIESEGESALFTADACPFISHLERLAWVAGIDLDPLTSMETKRRLIRDSLATDRLLIFDHDPNVAMARLAGTPERWEVRPVQPEG